MEDLLSYKGYHLVFEDRFDGTELDRSRWNVELHPPGWVNEELQEYVDSPENISVRDGILLIRPVKTVHGDGSVSYTSGRIVTQYKHHFTCGLFEARMKVPRGKGFLPAFWLMTTDEDRYGQWPECGEIDITADRYHLIIETYTIPRIGKIKLKRLTSRDLQKLYKDLMERGRIQKRSGKGNPGLRATTSCRCS